MPLPASPLPRLGGDARRATDLPPRQDAADHDQHAAEGRQPASATTERPAMQRHSSASARTSE